jgi:carboxymethylenebutenolidase
MTQRVTVPMSKGEVGAVVELPAGDARAPAVIVLQEWWGIGGPKGENILAITKKWATEGFIALAPDLYHGKIATTPDEAGAMMQALDFGKAVQEIAACVDHLKNHPRSAGKVAVTGYCMGGALAFATAVEVRGLAAVVPFYGLPGDKDWSKVDAPIQAHFARRDDWATVAGAEKIKKSVKVAMELHVYEAQHAFCNDRRPDVYNAEAAQTAWMRAVEFVRTNTQ